MAKEREGILLEKQLRERLDQEGVKYRVREKLSTFAAPELDLLILKPSLLIIEVVVDLDNIKRTERLKTKRWLANRIAIAEHFGLHVPVIVVIPDTEAKELEFIKETLSFSFDAVYTITEFPSIANIIRKVKISAFVEHLVHQGRPHEVRFTDWAEIESLWSHNLNLTDLARKAEFPDGSIAEKLRLYTNQHLKEDDYEQIARIGPAKYTPKALALEKLATSSRYQEGVNKLLYREITERTGFGVTERTMQLPISKKRSILIKGAVWESSKASVFIRRLMVSPSLMLRKTQEIVAESWLLRALQPHKVNGFLLLLSHSTSETVNSHAINTLEAAGWTVYPWDFAQSQPSFMEYLKYKQ